MAAIAMPEFDTRKLERIRDRLTPLTAMDLSDLGLPGLDEIGRQLDQVGKEAERARDRLTGRSRRSIWPRLAVGLGLLAVVGLAVLLLGSNRRSPWSLIEDDLDDGPDRVFDTPPADLAATTMNEPSSVVDIPPSESDVSPISASMGTGLTAAEASLMTTDPSEETA
jgi:hypothetical protein